MTYHLFLDDERHPACIPGGLWKGAVWANTLEQALWYLERLGPPTYMYLDHDLGGSDTAMDYLKILADKFPDTPPRYQIHSQNPVGADNIKAFMESWKKSTTLK